MDGSKIVNRYDTLKGNLGAFPNRWDILAKYFAPTRYGVTQGSHVTVGLNVTREIYDSTGHYAGDVFGNFLADKIINRANKWFGAGAKNPAIRSNDEVKEWFEECVDRQLDDYAASNFYTQATEMIKDYGVFATGSLFGAERPYLPTDPPKFGYRGSHFVCYPIGRYVIAENAAGEVDTHICEFKLSARAAVSTFPEGQLPDDVKKAAQNADLDKQFDFLYSVSPREYRDRMGKMGAMRMPWTAQYIEKNSQRIVQESGFSRFEFTTARYGKRWSEYYGRGFGELALNDAQTLNLAKAMSFKDWSLKIQPPIVARENSISGKLRMTPSGLTVVNTHGQAIQNTIMPWQTGSHPEMSAIKEEELRQAILQTFYVQHILRLMEIEKLPRETTATTYLNALTLLYGLLGPIYGALESEFTRPRVESDFFRLYSEGVFSPPPDVLLDQGQGQISFEFQNPLSRAQRMGELEAIDAGLARLGQIGAAQMQVEQASDVLDWIDIDATAKKILDITGVPATCVRSMEQVLEIRDARSRQQQAAMQQQQLALMAQSAGQAAPMVKALGDMQPQGTA